MLSSILRRGLAAAALLLAAGRVFAAAAQPLRIYWTDVEGGGATLIVTPAGQGILIDSGNPGDRDAGRIAATVRAAGLTRIDYYITTHFHIDHFGGAARLSALLPIAVVYDNGVPEHDPDHNPSDAFWKQAIRPYRQFHAGERRLTRPGLELPLAQAEGSLSVRLRCIGCRQQFIAAPAGTGPNPLAGENSAKRLAPTDNDNSSAWVLNLAASGFGTGAISPGTGRRTWFCRSTGSGRSMSIRSIITGSMSATTRC